MGISMRMFIFCILGMLLMSCDPPYTFPTQYHIPPEDLTILPKKDAYKVGERAEIHIVIPPLVKESNLGGLTSIEEVMGHLPKRLALGVSKIDKNERINLYLNGEKIDMANINFVYDDNSKSYILEDKLSLEFLKAGNTLLKHCLRIANIYFRIGDRANEMEFSSTIGNRIIKIE